MKPATAATKTPRKRASHLTDQAVYEVLKALSAGTSTASAKLETIASSAGLDRSTVWRAVRRLREAGRIDFATRHGRLTEYALHGLFVGSPSK